MPEIPHSRPDELVPPQDAAIDLHAEREAVPAPDFRQNVRELEVIAANGIETPRGVEQYKFRAGIEVEFDLSAPESFRERFAALTQDGQRSLALNKVKNPEQIDGSVKTTPEQLDNFRQQARDLIQSLPAESEQEEKKREAWLSQISGFGVRELINFQLYTEFSNPTLGNASPPSNATLEELDAFSESQGWLEFRFGTGTFQSGYYDNENKCELRIAPCEPSEALRRKEIIINRLVEIASEHGVLVESDRAHEDVNLSTHKKQPDGSYRSIIGQDDEHRPETTNVLAGVAAAFQDGLSLHPGEMKSADYLFNPRYDQYGGMQMSVGPTRKVLRVMDGRVELRGRSYGTDHGMNWLMAGQLYELSNGAIKIKDEGYSIVEEATTYHVHRATGFDKDDDLRIQRAFESAMPDGQGFELNAGYNMFRFGEVTTALLGKKPDGASDIFNDVIFAAVRLNDDGVPQLSVDTLVAAYEKLDEDLRPNVTKYGIGSTPAPELVARLNDRLKAVRLSPTTVLLGDIQYRARGQDAAMKRIHTSPVADLALRHKVEEYTAWLAAV